jgi:hypothetical protein
MGGRSLTRQQRLFAELLVSGCSKVEAFRRAYPSDRRSRTTEWQGGKRVAGLQQVRDEVQRLTLLHSPHDPAAQTDHIVARLIELSKDANPEVALRAIAQWSKLAEAGLLKPPVVEARADQPFDRAQAIDELRRLYAKALSKTENEVLRPPSAEPQEVTGQVIDIEADDMPADMPGPISAPEVMPPASMLSHAPVNDPPSKEDTMLEGDHTPLLAPEIESGTVSTREVYAGDGYVEAGEQHLMDGPGLEEINRRTVDSHRYELVRMPGHFGREKFVRRPVR